ncbi:hypothetical protein SORBI_3003G145300 [Sorghum bicolor]|uniref:Uncharacterized protein n=1 Tax=Sorghum bicolor TaxID=4558 RepID=A0A1B6Q381_SORBI|nr:hypothetical protein SORBI_3003G145300 [Sorghum bicolor]
MALPALSAPPQVTGRRRCGVRAVRMGCFGDPEMKRRRRVAGYKAYAVKGKVVQAQVLPHLEFLTTVRRRRALPLFLYRNNYGMHSSVHCQFMG